MFSISQQHIYSIDCPLLITNLHSQLQKQRLLNQQYITQLLQVQKKIYQLQKHSTLFQQNSLFHRDLTSSQIILPSNSSNLTDFIKDHFDNIDSPFPIQQIQSSFKAELFCLLKKKLITVFRKKNLLLQNITGIRKQSNLFQSHKRVILKDLLDDLRAQNKLLDNQNINSALQSPDSNDLQLKLQAIQDNLKFLAQQRTAYQPLTL